MTAVVCVTFCHRLHMLYWNHDDCLPEDCPFAEGSHGRCTDCRNRDGDVCSLTNAPLPECGGCCHWDVGWVQGLQVVTADMLAPLGFGGGGDDIAGILDALDAPYHVDGEGAIHVTPDELGLPFVYGCGTDPAEDEPPPPVEEYSREAMVDAYLW